MVKRLIINKANMFWLTILYQGSKKLKKKVKRKKENKAL